MPDVTDTTETLEALTREREQAIEWAVRLEGETHRLEGETHRLEERLAATVEALRGATARVFEERRLLVPMRLERDSLDAEVRRLRRAVEAAERRVIDLEETLEARDAEVSDLVDRLSLYDLERLAAEADEVADA